jgi:hypothetical protein
VANATAGAFEYLLKQHSGSNYDVSRMFIYYNARKLEGSDIEDEGTAIHDAVESLKKYGVCAEETWPFNPRHVNAKPHDRAYTEATEAEVDGLEQVETELDQWRHCLAEGRPVIFGVKLFDSFDKARKGKVPMPTEKEKQRNKHGRHAMLAVGYSDTDQLFIVRNSWGTDWGDEGYCYLPYDYLMSDEYNSGDSWVIRHVNGAGEPDRTTWGDDTSILPDFDDAERHRMDDDAYQAMIEALGDVPLESRVALIFLVAAGADGTLTDDEVKAIADEVQTLHDALGSKLSAHKVLRFAQKHLGDEALLEESVALLGAHLSKGLLASLMKSMRTIAGTDGLGDDEAAFLDEVTSLWEVTGDEESDEEETTDENAVGDDEESDDDDTEASDDDDSDDTEAGDDSDDTDDGEEGDEDDDDDEDGEEEDDEG